MLALGVARETWKLSQICYSFEVISVERFI
jgi:hypothetical protein